MNQKQIVEDQLRSVKAPETSTSISNKHRSKKLILIILGGILLTTAIFISSYVVAFKLLSDTNTSNSKVSSSNSSVESTNQSTTTTLLSSSSSSKELAFVPSTKSVECNGGQNDRTGKTDIDYYANDLQEKYSLCVSFFNLPVHTSPIVSYDSMPSENFAILKSMLVAIDEEFNKYNERFIKNVGIKQIILVDNLSINKYKVGGTIDIDKHILIISYRDIYPSPYARMIIHHELFHLLDYNIYGANYFDEKWAALNPTGFEYSKDVLDCTQNLPDQPEGFVSKYSACSINEDKAEVFSYLMIEFIRKDAKAIIDNGDKILGKKIDLMIQFVAEQGLEIEPLN